MQFVTMLITYNKVLQDINDWKIKYSVTVETGPDSILTNDKYVGPDRHC